ncbi:MAG: hypothetical protein K0R67_1430 [Paenibacillus sp.]|nr:hypothetical protein [Paenibacillus sp.]
MVLMLKGCVISMQMKWFRKKSDGSQTTVIVNSEANTSGKIAPAYAGEDSAHAILSARNMNNWLDDAVRECEQSGGLEHLNNKGKPIVVRGGDPMNSILKNANVLPAWLEMQQEIRKQMLLLIERMDNGQQDITEQLSSINAKITKYNHSVPTPVLQKGRLAEDSVREQIELWL